MTSSRRALLATLPALFAIPALASCDAGKSPDANQSSGTGAPATENAFPATVTHKYGETVIDQAPARVVCVGLNDQDALLALGVVPVGVTAWFSDEVPGRIYPWALDRLGGADLPEVLDNNDSVQLERIAALAPDLIIGQYAGLTEVEYQELSKIAPTVAQPSEFADWGVPWDVQTRTIGAAIGKPAEAEALVRSIYDLFAKAAADHESSFAGRTGVVLAAYEGIWIYGPQDPRARILEQLGIAFPEELKNPDSEQFGWSISVERASDLAEVDVINWGTPQEVIDQEIGKVWQETKAAKQGRAFYAPEEESKVYQAASNFVTPLSIPYFLDRYIPKLVAAIDGDPSTEVPIVTD